MSDLKKALSDLLNDDSDSANAMFSDDQDERLTELCKSIDWFDPDVRRAVADTVTTKLEEQIRTEDLARFFSRVKNYKPGDTPEFTFRKGLKAYVHEPGTYAPRSHFIQRTLTLTTELVSVNPEMEIVQLEAGRYGNIADIKREAKRELLGRRNATLWNVLINSIATTDANYHLGGAGSNAVIKNLVASGLDYVDDTAPGGAMAIVGRRSRMGWINELDTFSSETKKGRVESSAGKILGDYNGVPVVALHQYTDGYDVNRINADNIMIVAKDTTMFARTERLRSLDNIVADTRMWNIHFSEKYGAAVFWPEYNFRIAF
jgi:hypothetical protein